MTSSNYACFSGNTSFKSSFLKPDNDFVYLSIYLCISKDHHNIYSVIKLHVSGTNGL